MSKKNTLIEEYIRNVDDWLPYPQNEKSEILDNLHAEVTEAIHDKNNPDPTVAFGDPYDIAKGLSLGQDWGMSPANWYVRTVAFMIDVILILSICSIYLLIGFLVFFRFNLEAVLSIEKLGDAIEILQGDLGIGSFLLQIFLLLLFVFGAVVIYSSYFIVLEKQYSSTVGKKLLGLQAVDISGIRLTWKQSILRNFTKLPGFVEFLPFDVILGMFLSKKDEIQYQKATEMLTETMVRGRSNDEASANE
jgi:uncharacterized RDD family membrane protein YckC